MKAALPNFSEDEHRKIIKLSEEEKKQPSRQ